MNIVEHFRRAAHRANAASVESFDQQAVARELGHNNGICYGLVLAWLRHWRRNEAAGAVNWGYIFSRQLTQYTANAASGQGPTGFVGNLSNVHTNHQHHYQNLEGLRAPINGAINVLEQAGLHLREERNIDHGPARWFRAARRIASHPGYYVICTPSHAMGAIVRGQVWVFCDPNAGEATFTSAGRFRDFVGRYANHRINRYRGANHATFHLSLRRYQ